MMDLKSGIPGGMRTFYNMTLNACKRFFQVGLSCATNIYGDFCEFFKKGKSLFKKFFLLLNKKKRISTKRCCIDEGDKNAFGFFIWTCNVVEGTFP